MYNIIMSLRAPLHRLFSRRANDNSPYIKIPSQGFLEKLCARLERKPLISLVLEFGRFAEGLVRKNLELEAEVKRLEKLAMKDSLTGLNNKRAFDELMERLFKKEPVSEDLRTKKTKEREHAPEITAIAIDVNGFTETNTAFGHEETNKVLKALARDVFEPSVRDTDYVARVGGDEFTIILFNAGPKGIKRVLERLEENRTKTWVNVGKGKEIRPGLSLGVYTASPDDAIVDFLNKADAALYADKNRQGEDRKILEVRDSHSPNLASRPPVAGLG